MSSSLHPYSYVQNGELAYEFTTVNGDVYVAYFLDMAAYSPYFTDVYTFNFELRDSNTIPQQDGRVADTICVIMRRIFESNRNAVIITCDNTDHREQGRNRLFQQWYARFGDPSIYKIDRQYHSEDYDIYSSLLIHEQNPNREHIEAAFIQLSEHGFIPEE